MYCIYIVVLILHGLIYELRLSLINWALLYDLDWSTWVPLPSYIVLQHPSVVSEKSWDTKDDKMKYMTFCKKASNRKIVYELHLFEGTSQAASRKLEFCTNMFCLNQRHFWAIQYRQGAMEIWFWEDNFGQNFMIPNKIAPSYKCCKKA